MAEAQSHRSAEAKDWSRIAGETMRMYGLDSRQMSPTKQSRQRLYCDSNNSSSNNNSDKDPNFYQVRISHETLHQTPHLYPDLTPTGSGRFMRGQTQMGDAIEVVRRNFPPIQPKRTEVIEHPLDLTTQSSGRLIGLRPPVPLHQFVNDQAFAMSEKSSLVDQNAFRNEMALEKDPTNLPLFVNQENARLEAMNSMQHQQQQLTHLDPRGFKTGGVSFQDFTPTAHMRQSSNESDYERDEVTATPWQKNSLARLRKHLEKRQGSRLRTPAIRRSDALSAEGVVEDSEFYRELIDGIERTYNSSRQTLRSSFAAEFNPINSRPLVEENSYFEENQRRNFETGNERWDPSSFDSHWTGKSLEQILLLAAQPTFQRAVEEFRSNPRSSSDLPSGVRGPSGSPSHSPVAVHRDRVSPDTRSMPDLGTRRMSFVQGGLPPRRSKSTGNDTTKNEGHGEDVDLNPVTSEPKIRTNSEGEISESYSPDQSMDPVELRSENVPMDIVTSDRLNGAFGFSSSTATEAVLEGRDTRPEAPSDSSSNRNSVPSPGVLMQLQLVMTANGSPGSGGSGGGGGGGGRRSTAEQPSSTFEEDSEAKIKDDAPTNGNTRQSESGIPCKICLDVANGFHYGVWSCEGCKAFFKRSITGSSRYVCPADNNCTINRLRKKSCQACRLRKCYEFGMSPGNCRGEHGSRLGRKRKLPESHLDKRESHENVKQSRFDERKMNLKVGYSDRDDGVDLAVGPQTSLSPSMKTGNGTSPGKGISGILEHLVTIERPMRHVDYDERSSLEASRSSSSVKVIGSLVKLVNAQLLDIVKWSLNLPGFKELEINIRTQMLLSSWAEILLLTYSFHSLQTPNAFVMAPNFHLTREKCESIGILFLYNHLMRIIRMLKALQLSHEQLLLLQAIVLINTDLALPGMFPPLDELLSHLLSALNETRFPLPSGRSVEASSGPSDARGHRDLVARLLLVLPHLRHCGLQFIGILSDVSKDSGAPECSLLRDVLDNRRQLNNITIIGDKL